MNATRLTSPNTDPTPIFELFRGNHATELLAAAVGHFRLFEYLSKGRLTFDQLREKTQLADRPMNVLLTAMRAMRLIVRGSDGLFELTPIAAEHLVAGREFDVSAYVGLAADSPGVRGMIERLTTNRPAMADTGAAFIYREGLESQMDAEASARRLTLALAGRAKNVAPVLAERVNLSSAKCVLDVGGGTGIYAFAMLRKNPRLRAVIFDRAQVLNIAREMAHEYGVADRADFIAGDMFTDPLPACDVVLLSNVLHDWDIPACRQLVQRCADRLPAGGRVLIHDVFLDDDLGGPLPIALYSASLFSLTEGRAYSAAEYRQWLTEAGLQPGDKSPTLVHCGVIAGTKTSAVGRD